MNDLDYLFQWFMFLTSALALADSTWALWRGRKIVNAMQQDWRRK